MAADLRRHAEIMRTVAADCEADATRVDSRPFTGRGVGEALGEMLAMIAACAKSVAVLADTLADHDDTSDDEPGAV
jgi:hypothetical protein